VTHEVLVRQVAESDLEAAQDWYERQRQGLGAEFREAVDLLFRRLADNPRIYPIVYLSTRRAVLRRFPYVVYFTVEDATVVVLACLDSRDEMISAADAVFLEYDRAEAAE
jgi:toxin ParE1/3/4